MQNLKKKFLKLPEYPGGKEAFKKYLLKNLKYPQTAIEKRIQGIVYLMAEIDDNGTVHQVDVLKGLGAGCDEEAVRLIRDVNFGGVKNRGVRVKTRKKFRIEFKLPPQKKVQYNIASSAATKESTSSPKKYSYTIQLNN